MFKNNKFAISTPAEMVKVYLSNMDGIESSFDEFYDGYKADVSYSQWLNGRERGYSFVMKNSKGKDVCFSVFEHRSSDDICVLPWEVKERHGCDYSFKEFNEEHDEEYYKKNIKHFRYNQVIDVAWFIKNSFEEKW